MDSFYSLEEEIAWGPKGLDEIKDDFRRPQVRKPDKRYTIHCVLEPDTNNLNKVPKKKNKNKMEHLNINENLRNATQDDSIPEISTYLTASEVRSVRNENDISEYMSAVENLASISSKNCSERQNSACDSNSDFKSSAEKNIPEDIYSSKDISRFNFVQKFINRPSDYIFKTEQQTFMDSPVSSPDNSFKENNQNNSNSVIEISSDEESLETNRNLSCVQEISDENIYDTSGFSDKDCSKEEEIHEVESYCKNNDSSCADISINDNSSCLISSAISIPEIDLHQFNESSDCPLNDTIERINALLNQAENMSIKEESDQEQSSCENICKGGIRSTVDQHTSDYGEDKTTLNDNKLETYKKIGYNLNDNSGDDFPQTCNLISGSFLQKPMSDWCTQNTPIKYCTEVKTPKSRVPVFKKSPQSFRIPNIPSKLKSSQKLSKPNFKDVISPVGIYIKYSPKPVLQRRPTSADKINTKVNVVPKQCKEKDNGNVFPNVIYKPSKKQIIASDKQINLPPSIGKLVVNTNLIKHDKKLISKSLFRRDESLNTESELTKSSLSDSQISEVDHNVSVLYKKTPFRQ